MSFDISLYSKNTLGHVKLPWLFSISLFFLYFSFVMCNIKLNSMENNWTAPRYYSLSHGQLKAGIYGGTQNLKELDQPAYNETCFAYTYIYVFLRKKCIFFRKTKYGKWKQIYFCIKKNINENKQLYNQKEIFNFLKEITRILFCSLSLLGCMEPRK